MLERQLPLLARKGTSHHEYKDEKVVEQAIIQHSNPVRLTTLTSIIKKDQEKDPPAIVHQKRSYIEQGSKGTDLLAREKLISPDRAKGLFLGSHTSGSLTDLGLALSNNVDKISGRPEKRYKGNTHANVLLISMRHTFQKVTMPKERQTNARDHERQGES